MSASNASNLKVASWLTDEDWSVTVVFALQDKVTAMRAVHELSDQIRSRSVFEKKENLGVCAKQKVRLGKLRPNSDY